MLSILTAPPRGGNHHTVIPARRRRSQLRPCPRCGQWRSHGQYPLDAAMCGACVEAVDRQAQRVAGVVERSRPLRGAEKIAEVEWMLDVGYTAAEVCQAVRSPSVHALERALYRAGRDLARRIGAYR